MNGGLGKMSRYLLAGASVIGLLAFGAPEANAQNLQEIQAQINQMQDAAICSVTANVAWSRATLPARIWLERLVRPGHCQEAHPDDEQDHQQDDHEDGTEPRHITPPLAPKVIPRSYGLGPSPPRAEPVNPADSVCRRTTEPQSSQRAQGHPQGIFLSLRSLRPLRFKPLRNQDLTPASFRRKSPTRGP